MFNFKKNESAKSNTKSSFSKGFKKEVMKGYKADTKKMSKQDRVNRELACQSVFGMSSEKFMKTMLK